MFGGACADWKSLTAWLDDVTVCPINGVISWTTFRLVASSIGSSIGIWEYVSGQMAARMACMSLVDRIGKISF